MGNQAFEVVREICEGERSCEIQVNDNVFGDDPRPGTQKHAVVEYYCEKSDDSSDESDDSSHESSAHQHSADASGPVDDSAETEDPTSEAGIQLESVDHMGASVSKSNLPLSLFLVYLTITAYPAIWSSIVHFLRSSPIVDIFNQVRISVNIVTGNELAR